MRKIRELLEMSQVEFSRLLGIDPKTISRWENGIGKPTFTIGQIKRLLEALQPFGIKLEDLPDDLGLAGQK